MAVEMNDVIFLEIRAIPNASKTEAIGAHEGILKVRIAAAPTDGKANKALREYLSKLIGCSKSEIVLVRGEKSRQKIFSIPVRYAEAVENCRRNQTREI